MDLGSALLSAERALDLLPDPAVRDRVTLSPAPLVEGLVVAAVAAAGGATRAEVAAEARGALLGKVAHLSVPDNRGEPDAVQVGQDEVRPLSPAQPFDGLQCRRSGHAPRKQRTR
jgi:phosphocarrier protein FPr